MSSAPPPYGPPPPYGEPPAPYQPPAYEPFHTPAAAPVPQQRRGLIGTLLSGLLAIWAVVKWAGVFLLKFGAVKTLLTLLVSFGFYAWFRGPEFALALVVMILIHEMGHVFEIRRQGMQATAPLFIPFLGAAIFQRSHPVDALRQAQIGIAGPIAGALATLAALALYGATHFGIFLLGAWLGALLNLFNLIPFGPLDGGWVLAAASKWFQVAGLGLIAVAVFFFHFVFGPVLIIILLFGIPTMIERFRNDKLPYYQTVPPTARLAMGGAWLVLVAFLGYLGVQTLNALGPVG